MSSNSSAESSVLQKHLGSSHHIEAIRDPKWYAAFTMPRHEKRVSRHCNERKIESFLPLYNTKRKWKNRHTAEIDAPLFPNYIFVRIDQKERIRVLKVPGIVSIVSAGRQLLPLSDVYITALRDGLLSHNIEPCCNVEIGDRVVITQGPMAGMEGILERRKNEIRVILRLEMIGRSLSVEIGAEELSPVTDPANRAFIAA